MIPNLGRNVGTFVLTALAVLSVQDVRAAATAGDFTTSSPSVPTDLTAGFVATSWTLGQNAQLALVGAGNGNARVFAGIQCDPVDPRSHRIIIGAVRTHQTDELLGLLRNQSAKLLISTTAMSLSSQFEIYPEDRGHSNFGGASDYAAAYLTQQQFDALNSAKTFVIRTGSQSFTFSGTGSSRAIGGLACHGSEHHVATRLIESRRDDASVQRLGAWQLAFHTGPAAPIKGRVEAFTDTTNHPANVAASFRFGVTCSKRRLFAHLDVGINPAAKDDTQSGKTNAFVHEFAAHGKLVEVYRAGQRVATFLVDNDEMHGRGHPLSSQEIASLMDSDGLAVVGDHTVIEFSTVNAAPRLVDLSRICSTTG